MLQPVHPVLHLLRAGELRNRNLLRRDLHLPHSDYGRLSIAWGATMTPTAQQQAEEARQAAYEAADEYARMAASDAHAYESGHPRREAHEGRKDCCAAIDRYGLLARLAQAEVSCSLAPAGDSTKRLRRCLRDERDRLRREVEEVERG